EHGDFLPYALLARQPACALGFPAHQPAIEGPASPWGRLSMNILCAFQFNSLGFQMAIANHAIATLSQQWARGVLRLKSIRMGPRSCRAAPRQIRAGEFQTTSFARAPGPDHPITGHELTAMHDPDLL